MTFILLIRMSNESKRRKRKKDRAASKVPAYITGLDLDSKEIHIKRCRELIEARGGKVGAIYMEPHTSAWKRRKLKDAEGNTIYRVVRPVISRPCKGPSARDIEGWGGDTRNDVRRPWTGSPAITETWKTESMP